MNARTLRAHLKAKRMSQSELARRAGVSRQAVSSWLGKGGYVNLQGRHLIRVSRALGVSVEELVRPLPCFHSDQHYPILARHPADRLSPDLDEFAIALHR